MAMKRKKPIGTINTYIVSFTDFKGKRKSKIVRTFGGKFEAINKIRGEDFSRKDISVRIKKRKK